MASESASGFVDVDSRRVVNEVLVDGEAGFERSVVGELGLHQGSSLVSRDGVDLAGLVCLPCSLTSAFASDATRSGLEVQAWLLVWWASWDGVWLARVGWQSRALDEVPGDAGFSSLATVGHHVAGNHVLGGEDGVLGLSGDYAVTVSEGLDSTEGPAGTAFGLVPDEAHGRALGPLVGRGEVDWEVLRHGEDEWWELDTAGLSVSQEALDLIERFVLEVRVGASGPSRTSIVVDFLDEVVVDVSTRERHEAREDQSKECQIGRAHV